jgi:hypothetical protein
MRLPEEQLAGAAECEPGDEPEQAAGKADALAGLLAGWANPAFPAAERGAALPDLASLAGGTTRGLVPAGFSRDLLEAARPLQQARAAFPPPPPGTCIG